VGPAIFDQHLTKITGILHEDARAFIIVSRRILLRMRNVLDKRFRETQNTILCSLKFLENRVL